MIRFADFKDFDRIIEMLVNYANTAPVPALHNPEYDLRRTQHSLAHIIANGCIIVATDSDDVPQGMLLAAIVPDMWLPHVKALRELAWWVEPEFRNTTMGYRLMSKYIEYGESLRDAGVIDNFTLSLLSISPDLKLEKRGFREIETTYVFEG